MASSLLVKTKFKHSDSDVTAALVDNSKCTVKTVTFKFLGLLN